MIDTHDVVYATGGYSGGIVSAFPRLRAMLEPIPPGNSRIIDMTVGEPRHAMPKWAAEKMLEAADGLQKYPPLKGSDELLASITQWLERRFRLGGKIDGQKHVMILNGSREGLFAAVFPAAGRKKVKGRPAVLLPNPFYAPYVAAAMAVGAEPAYLPATTDTGGLPDLDALAAKTDLLQRTVAFYLCSPANPQGSAASKDYLLKAIALARKYDFMLFADECYSEIYTRAAPVGALEVAVETPDGFKNVVVFNSLSKRSNLPGLRSGLVAGDADFMRRLLDFRNVSAPHVPIPVQHASAALWAEEQHVTENRRLYQAKFDLADRKLAGRFGYRRPDGGFFLWLDMSQFGGGELATLTLWKRAGVKVVPGAFLAMPGDEGTNPGASHVRVALVHDLPTTEEALDRIIAALRQE